MEDDNVVAVGGLIRVAQCIDLNPAVKRDPGQSMTYHLPWNFLTSMQVMEYDRSFLASRILLDGFNGNLIRRAGGRHGAGGQAPRLLPEQYDPLLHPL